MESPRPPASPLYGALRSPKRGTPTSPRDVLAADPEQAGDVDGVVTLKDPRHQDVTPVPWLRYFFPKDFDVREGVDENAYYQYFDVTVSPLEEDITVPPPKWTPNAYFRLSFTQSNLALHEDVAARLPDHSSPLDALDFTKADWPIFAEGAEQHLESVKTFCRSVTTFKARTWKDAFPLVDLLRGLLIYLLDHMAKGQQLALEYAKRDAAKQVEEERQRAQEQHARDMATAEAEWEKAAQKRVEAAKESARKMVMEEMAAQMKAMSEEKEKWVQKCILGEQQARKLNETISSLQIELEGLQQQMDAERLAQAKALSDREGQIKSQASRIRDLEAALAKAQQGIIDALNARGKKEVLSVVTAAAAVAVPGGHAYVAQLRTKDNVDDAEDELLREAREAVMVDPEGPLRDSLNHITGGLLSSPLDVTGEHPMANSEEAHQNLVLQYVNASEGQEFMVGQRLGFGDGISWGVVLEATEAAVKAQSVAGSGAAAVAKRRNGSSQSAGLSSHSLCVQDVSETDGVHFFRPSTAAGSSHGSYLAIPLTGHHGEVVGLLGVDTIAAAMAAAGASGMMKADPRATQLGDSQVDYVKQLAAAASQAIANEQEEIADIMLKASLLNTKVELHDEAPVEVDPEPYADMKGGVKLFAEALEMAKGLTDEDITVLQTVDKPDDATLAIVRSVLAAAGEVNDSDWSTLKAQISRDLLNKLVEMDPKSAWGEWQNVCRMMSPLMRAESELGRLDQNLEEDADETHGEGWEQARNLTFTKSMGRLLVAVRKISAANALLEAMRERLVRANKAIMKTFQGDGSSALVELRTYRVPPKMTFLVLQAALLLCGNSEEDCKNWGKMRILTNYKMIKKLTEVKPEAADPRHIQMCKKVVETCDEDDVKKESMATLVLFKWLGNFAQVGQLAQMPA